jgi:hypothetical protein
MCPFINFFPVIGTNKIIFLTLVLNNINQYLSFNLLSEIWNSGLSFHVNASMLYVS